MAANEGVDRVEQAKKAPVGEPAEREVPHNDLHRPPGHPATRQEAGDRRLHSSDPAGCKCHRERPAVHLCTQHLHDPGTNLRVVEKEAAGLEAPHPPGHELLGEGPIRAEGPQVVDVSVVLQGRARRGPNHKSGAPIAEPGAGRDPQLSGCLVGVPGLGEEKAPREAHRQDRPANHHRRQGAQPPPKPGPPCHAEVLGRHRWQGEVSGQPARNPQPVEAILHICASKVEPEQLELDRRALYLHSGEGLGCEQIDARRDPEPGICPPGVHNQALAHPLLLPDGEKAHALHAVFQGDHQSSLVQLSDQTAILLLIVAQPPVHELLCVNLRDLVLRPQHALLISLQVGEGVRWQEGFERRAVMHVVRQRKQLETEGS